MTESTEQKTLMRWWWLSHRGLGVPDPRLLFHIPNGAFLGGGKLGAMRGGRLRAEGMVKGVPDLFLAVARGEAHGLFIEMKRAKGGRESEEQKAMRSVLVVQGYSVAVCHGWEEASRDIQTYLRVGEVKTKVLTRQHH